MANLFKDPLVFDLDGDGVELVSLANSAVHFDYDTDGFAERTGWVSGDDGILVRDINGNGAVDSAGELFGSPNQDGFAVLETLDTNGDGKIDSQDEHFGQLRVWRDLNQNGATDAGEMQSLTDAGIDSISLIRTDVPGTSQGHTIGYEATFTRANGSTGTAQTIYFQTDRQDTTATDNTPTFTPAEGVSKLPQFSGSGQINSIAWKLTQDADFRTQWTALTDNASTLSVSELRAQFEAMLLRWAGVSAVEETSRGQWVDARHLAFVEAFFGDQYREVGNAFATTSPSSEAFGLRVEASFNQIADTLLTVFLAQTNASVIARGGDIEAIVTSPYFAYALLQFAQETNSPPNSLQQGVEAAAKMMVAMAPEQTGAAAAYLAKALSGLDGMVNVAFSGNRATYAQALENELAELTNPDLLKLASAIVSGTARLGTAATEGLLGGNGADVFIAGDGNDVIVSGGGSDLFIYSAGDGSDVIRDTSTSLTDDDRLLLTNINLSDLSFERVGDSLRVRIASSGETIVSEGYFKNWGEENRGIDSIVLANGDVLDRAAVLARTVVVGGGNDDAISDSALDDVILAGAGDDQITISAGSDTIVYTKGDGTDRIIDTSGNVAERDTLVLSGVDPADVQLSRVGEALVIKILTSGEQLTDAKFFANNSVQSDAGGWGLDRIKFDSGIVWDRAVIKNAAWIRGNDKENGLSGFDGNDMLQGNRGRDTLAGGKGSDTYVWKKGDGSDTIAEHDEGASTDTLHLIDVQAGDVELSRRGTSLLVTIRSTGEVLEISYQFYGIDNIVDDWNAKQYGIENIKFANGVTWTREAIMKGIVNVGLDLQISTTTLDGVVIKSEFVDELGHIGNIVDVEAAAYSLVGVHPDDIKLGGWLDDRIGGSYLNVHQNDPLYDGVLSLDSGNNYFDGRGGNDLLIGGNGHDTLVGGAGNDTLYGDQETTAGNSGSGNDVLDGGDGNDVLYGGGGNDYLNGGSGADELHGGAGDDNLTDTDVGNDVFEGGTGDDLIVAGARWFDSGSDTFIYSRFDGNDIISDQSGGTVDHDRLILRNISPDEVRLSRTGLNLVITDLVTGQTITDSEYFYWDGEGSGGIDSIEFSNGTVWNREYILQNAYFRGTAGRDVLETTSSADNTFMGYEGDDVLYSGWYGNVHNGSDTFIYRSGDGNDTIIDPSVGGEQIDTLVLADLTSSQIELTRDGFNVLIRDLTTGQVITGVRALWGAEGIDAIKFSDGVVWDKVAINERSWLRGNVTNDVIQWDNGGNNTYFGGLGDDVLISGDWKNSISLDNGDDTFIYRLGDGNDVIYERDYYGNDIDTLQFLDVNPADITLHADGANIIVRFLANTQFITLDTNLYGNFGVERFVFADGTIWNRSQIAYWAGPGSMFYTGTSNADTINGSHLDQRLSGGGSDDFIDGKAGSDQLFGDAGNDMLSISVAEQGDVDSLNGGADNDTVTLEQFSSSVFIDLVANNGEVRTSDGVTRAGAGDRLIATVVDVENIRGSQEDDYLAGDDRANQIRGNEGDDVIDGRSGNDSLFGGAGNDVIDGYIGNDTIEGGVGNDQLIGGLGNDTYVFTAGDGDDTIEELVGGGESDTLRLIGISPSQLAFMRSGTNLVLSFGGGALGSITLKAAAFSQYLDQYGVEQIEFGNGTVWSGDYLRQWSVYLSATDGNDTLVGTNASGDFGGGKGNDILNGGKGNDSYIYARGDGHDTIIEDYWGWGGDELRFTDINANAVTFLHSGNDVTVIVAESAPGAGDAGSILLKDSLNDDSERGVEKIAFADGTTLSRNQMRLLLLEQAGTSGNDNITGFTTSDLIQGRQGNDILNGGKGNDSYIYARGDGHDTIIEDYWGWDGDEVRFSDINANAITLVRNGNDLRILIAESSPGAGDAGSILLKESILDDAQRGVEKIVFADGTIWTRAQMRANIAYVGGTDGNDTIVGTSGPDADIRAGVGDDVLNGLAGSDTYVYRLGDGNDTIDESGSTTDIDVLKFTDLNVDDLTFSRSGSHAKIKVNSTGHVITLDEQFYSTTANWGIERIEFADGTVWDRAAILAAMPVQGGSGNETLNGTSAADTLIGGLGNDMLRGGAGNDTYIYNRGDGHDTIEEASYDGNADKLVLNGVNPGSVSLVKYITDVTLVIADSAPGAGNAGSVLIKETLDDNNDRGIETIVFADGTSWSRSDLRVTMLATMSTSGNDTIHAFNVSDIIEGGAGNDTIYGWAGSDTFIYRRGHGHDTIIEDANNGNADQLVLVGINPNDVSLVKSGTDAKLIVRESSAGAGDGGSILIPATLDDASDRGVESIVFGDGTTWSRSQLRVEMLKMMSTSGHDTIDGFNVADVINAGSGNDTIRAWDGDDRIDGGAGNDTITGGGGNDTIVFKANFGHDTITDFVAGAGTAEVLEFDSSLFAGFEAVLLAAAQVGNDTVISYDAGNSITLKNVALTSLHQDDMRFVA